MCMLIYQSMVEGTLILRHSSTNVFLVWSLKFFHMKVVEFIVESEQKDYSTANMDVYVFITVPTQLIQIIKIPIC